MKILHISGAKGWGGNEQQIIDIIPQLEKLNIENTILCYSNSEISSKAKNFSIPTIEIKSKKLNSLSAIRKNFNEIIKISPDIIHLHTSDSLTFFVISDLLYRYKKHNIKVVFSKKGLGNSSSFLSKIKYNYSVLDRIICVSKAVEIGFGKIIKDKKKLITIYDGINIDRLNINSDVNKTNTSKEYQIVNIANHVSAKDLLTLLKSINYLVNEIKFKDFKITQYGSFNKKITPELIQYVKDHNLENHIKFEGFTANAYNKISNFDCYIMSSEREGLPLTIYEAFFYKIPVITTNAGGIPEIVKHKETGLICEVKDFKKLAENIKELIESNELRVKIIKNAHEILINSFTTTTTAEKYKKLYEEL